MSAHALKTEKQSNYILRLNKLKISTDKLLDITSVLWLSSLPIRTLFSMILAPFGLSGYSQLFTGLFIFTPFLLHIIITKENPCKYFIWVLAFCVIYFSITLFIHPEYQYWYQRSIYGVMYSVFRPDYGALWAFFAVEICKTPDRIWWTLKKYAIVLGIYNLYSIYIAEKVGYWTAFNAEGVLAERNYSLDFGYDMAFLVLMAVICFLETKKAYYLFVCCICSFLLLKYGSRGAFICILVFAVLLVLTQIVSLKQKITAIFICVASIPIYLNMNNIMLSFATLLNKFGISSRTILSILENNAYDDSGRDGIYALAKAALSNAPFLGYGAYGDRPIIGPYYYWGYVHNIYYEFLINFGILFGSIAIIYLLYKCIHFLRNCNNKLMLNIFIITFSMSMRLLVSDSFWRNKFFWMGIALLFMGKKFLKFKIRLKIGGD